MMWSPDLFRWLQEQITPLAARIRALELAQARRRRASGRTEITTGTNGTFTVTFPAAFPSTNYRVLANAEATAVTGTAYVVTVNSRAVGSVQLRLLDQSGNVGSGVTRIIHWDAEHLG